MSRIESETNPTPKEKMQRLEEAVRQIASILASPYGTEASRDKLQDLLSFGLEPGTSEG